MVRLIPVEKNGRIVWMEDAPAACAAGHPVVPSYGGCPVCDDPVRLWRCHEPGCEALYDDEHVHHSRRR